MNSKARFFVATTVVLFLTFHLAHAVVPISVFPNPADFGTVPEFSSSFPLVLYLSNNTNNIVNITTITISGADSGDFAFDGPNCAVPIGPGQTCQMAMLFSPTSIRNFTANLVIAVQGLKQPITVPLLGAGGNPIPAITSLVPPTAYVNSPGFTLTVNGTNFVPGAVVNWENTALTTTYVSSTQLTAQVPAADLTGTSSVFIAVTNPSPGGGTSSYVYFYVVALDPSLNFASPNALIAGTKSTTVTVNGNNFMDGAQVMWNGKALPTTFISPQQLQIQATSTQLANPGIIQLSVSNPAPGGLSPAINFDVTYPAKVTILDLPANDLLWDPYAQRIYASLPSSYGPNGNSIAVLDPVKGKVTGYFFAGSEPNRLARSIDSKYLYVGLNGNGSVQRMLLPNFAQDIDISLGSGPFGINTALDVEVSPGDPHTMAVAEAPSGCCGFSGLFFFTDSTQLPHSINSPTMTDLIFVDPATLYGYSNGQLSQVIVDSNGGTLGKQSNGLLQGSTIHYAAGLIYANGGQVMDPATGLEVGTYDVNGGCCSPNQLLPQSALDRVFVVGETPFFTNTFGITSYNLSQFTPVAVANLSQLSGSPTQAFTKWGNSGLAFALQSGCCGNGTTQLILVESPLMLLATGKAKNPVPVAGSLSPSNANHGSWNFPLTIQGTGFVPGSMVTWNGTALAADYVSSTQLTTYVPASDIVSPGTATVVVTNPKPGGGKSAPLTFTIN